MKKELIDKINNLIPIGSVISLKDMKMKVMITSYIFNDEVDYEGVAWPIGDYSNKALLYFKAEDITKVFFRGYENELVDGLKGELLDETEDIENDNNIKDVTINV